MKLSWVWVLSITLPSEVDFAVRPSEEISKLLKIKEAAIRQCSAEVNIGGGSGILGSLSDFCIVEDESLLDQLSSSLKSKLKMISGVRDFGYGHWGPCLNGRRVVGEVFFFFDFFFGGIGVVAMGRFSWPAMGVVKLGESRSVWDVFLSVSPRWVLLRSHTYIYLGQGPLQ